MKPIPVLFAALATLAAGQATAAEKVADKVVDKAADAASAVITTANLFPSQTWQPPPPPPSRPKPPEAPPLPYTYLGQLAEEGGITLFLGRQQRTLIVRAGDILDGSYRIDAVTPQRALITYLPLDIQQSLNLRNTP
jgi:hypothetical protein